VTTLCEAITSAMVAGGIIGLECFCCAHTASGTFRVGIWLSDLSVVDSRQPEPAMVWANYSGSLATF